MVLQLIGLGDYLHKMWFKITEINCVKVAQSYPTLCDPTDCSPPGSCVHRIVQARIQEWVAFPSPGYLPDPGIKPRSPALQADSLPSEPPGKPSLCSTIKQNEEIRRSSLLDRSLLVTLYPTFCYPVDCSPLGSFIHGIFQARILEWVCHLLLQKKGFFDQESNQATEVRAPNPNHWTTRERQVMSLIKKKKFQFRESKEHLPENIHPGVGKVRSDTQMKDECQTWNREKER